MKNRTILIIAINYYPEMVGCAKYTSELSEYLVECGYEVTVICAPPYYPAWKIQDGYSGWVWRQEYINGVKVQRVPIYVPTSTSGAKRIIHLLSFGLASLFSSLFYSIKRRPEIVFSVAPTLTSSLSALVAGRISGAKTWLHIQDFEVDAAFDLGILKNRFARNVALAVERRLFQSFDHLSSISSAMVALLEKKGVLRENISEVRNWVDIEKVTVISDGNTNYRRQLGIGSDKIVALYSGNMASKQGIEMLADVAVSLHASDPAVIFLLCGDGPARVALEEACSQLPNVRFLPLQPVERLPELLGTADIHLLPQRPEAADLVLPSKLTGMLASGRPIVAMAKPGSGLALEVDGVGIAVEPSADAMAKALVQLAGDAGLRSKLGAEARRRAEQRWQKGVILAGFKATLERLYMINRSDRLSNK